MGKQIRSTFLLAVCSILFSLSTFKLVACDSKKSPVHGIFGQRRGFLGLNQRQLIVSQRQGTQKNFEPLDISSSCSGPSGFADEAEAIIKSPVQLADTLEALSCSIEPTDDAAIIEQSGESEGFSIEDLRCMYGGKDYLALMETLRSVPYSDKKKVFLDEVREDLHPIVLLEYAVLLTQQEQEINKDVAYYYCLGIRKLYEAYAASWPILTKNIGEGAEAWVQFFVKQYGPLVKEACNGISTADVWQQVLAQCEPWTTGAVPTRRPNVNALDRGWISKFIRQHRLKNVETLLTNLSEQEIACGGLDQASNPRWGVRRAQALWQDGNDIFG